MSWVFQGCFIKVVEQSCQVWRSSPTLENVHDLECILALKIILQDEYQNYSNALHLTGLKSLFERRNELCLRFAKACTKNEQTKTMFPLNPISYDVETRHREKFQVTKCKTTRFQNSAIPFMQNLLNSEKLWKSITVKHWFKKWNFVFVLKTYHFNNKPLSLSLIFAKFISDNLTFPAWILLQRVAWTLTLSSLTSEIATKSWRGGAKRPRIEIN